MANRVGGTITFRRNGISYLAKGSFEYNLGRPMRETVTGQDEVHGFTEKPQPATVKGMITDDGTLDIDLLCRGEGELITLELANGKTVMLEEAWSQTEGAVKTETGEIEINFVARKGEEF